MARDRSDSIDEGDSLSLIGSPGVTDWEEIFVSVEGALTGSVEACTAVRFSKLAAFVSLAAIVDDTIGVGFAAGPITGSTARLRVRLSFS